MFWEERLRENGSSEGHPSCLSQCSVTEPQSCWYLECMKNYIGCWNKTNTKSGKQDQGRFGWEAQERERTMRRKLRPHWILQAQFCCGADTKLVVSQLNLGRGCGAAQYPQNSWTSTLLLLVHGLEIVIFQSSSLVLLILSRRGKGGRGQVTGGWGGVDASGSGVLGDSKCSVSTAKRLSVS